MYEVLDSIPSTKKKKEAKFPEHNCNIIHNSQSVETTQVPVDRRMEEENVIGVYLCI